jgi:glutamate synthase (NADPH/NADH) large chain
VKKYIKNKELLKQNHVYSDDMEHDACGVGIIASTEGKKSRKVVEYGIEALKAVWHRGAVDADGKTGDGAGIHVEIPKDFFIEKIEVTGHSRTISCFSICIYSTSMPNSFESFNPILNNFTRFFTFSGCNNSNSTRIMLHIVRVNMILF